MTDLAILRMAEGLARHASGRHALLARNIAHADTPGYRAVDLPDFASALREREQMRATRPTHLNGGPVARFEPQQSASFGSMSPNGNDVSLPDQMARATRANSTFTRAVAIYGKTLDILRMGLGKR